MERKQIDIRTLNGILQTTIESIKSSKDEIGEIVIYSKKECERLEKELDLIQINLLKKIEEVEKIEKINKKHRKTLANRSKNFEIFTEKEVQETYELANETRILLLLKREEEKNLIEKRKEIGRAHV